MHMALYQAATALAARTIRSGTLGASLSGRALAAQRWVRWAAERRREGPLIWLHAASVGETIAASAVIRRLEADGRAQIVRTYSSPSAARWPDRGTCHADYVPLDVTPSVTATLDALRPAALVFSRGDLWPVLVIEAQRRNIPVAVIGGTVRQSSRRLGWPAAPLLRAMHRDLQSVGAVSDQDAAGWHALGVKSDRLLVTGDPRHDALLERETSLAAVQALLAWKRDGRPLAIGGSVERTDEAALFGAINRLENAGPFARWLLVPHDPQEHAVRRLTEACEARGLPTQAWSGGPIPPSARCAVATQRGTLADLYLAADLAFVGGGFGGRGPHSVAEPASVGVPVLFGATGALGHDERALLAAGGAVGLKGATGIDLANACRHWMSGGGDPGRRAGLAGRRTVRSGAAQLSVGLVRAAAGLG
ncbi:MAG TPA: glycosyltransferase N-terminal domain-containing protein [Gemmatimonadales bacterium]